MLSHMAAMVKSILYGYVNGLVRYKRLKWRGRHYFKDIKEKTIVTNLEAEDYLQRKLIYSNPWVCLEFIGVIFSF